jgi:hypothetical protein
MKRLAFKEPLLILLALGVLAVIVYISPTVIGLLPNVPYRMVLFFIIVIITSNVLAKITQVYINS